MNEQAMEELHLLLHLIVTNQVLLAAARTQLLEQFDQFVAALESGS